MATIIDNIIYGVNCFKRELKFVSKQIKRNNRSIKFIKKEKAIFEDKLFFLNEQMKRIEKENKLLDEYNIIITDKLKEKKE